MWTHALKRGSLACLRSRDMLAAVATKLRMMSPHEALKDAILRSFAAGVGGFLVGGCLAAMDVFKERAFILAAMESACLGSLALLLAYYHKRWLRGICAIVLAVVTPWVATMLWVKFLSVSVIYLAAALILFGGSTLELAHRRIAGPQPEDELEEQLIEAMAEDLEARITWTWMERVTWLCITASVVILLILLSR